MESARLSFSNSLIAITFIGATVNLFLFCDGCLIFGTWPRNFDSAGLSSTVDITSYLLCFPNHRQQWKQYHTGQQNDCILERHYRFMSINHQFSIDTVWWNSRGTFSQDVTFVATMAALERKMLMNWCSSTGLEADSLWGGWLTSLWEMSISEIEAKEPHQPTVMLTIHPHLVNEHPPTLPILFLLPPPPALSPSPFFFALPPRLTHCLHAFFVCSFDSHAFWLASNSLSYPLNSPHSTKPSRNANYGNMKSLG